MKSVAAIAVVFLCSLTVLGYTAPLAVSKKQELSQIQSNIQQANLTIEQIRLKREKLIAQLQTIEKHYGATAKSLHELSLQIGGKQKHLKNISQEMQKKQSELKLQSKELSKQVKASFVMGRKEQLRLLLNQQDPAVASRMIVYYSYLNKSRLAKLTKLKKNLAVLEKLEHEKRRETGLLGRALHSHKTEQAHLTQTKKQRELLLLSLSEDFKRKSRKLNQLEESAAESQALIEKLQQAAFAREQQAAAATPAPSIIKPPTGLDKLDADGNPIPAHLESPEHSVASNEVSKPFAQLKGHLPWPLKGQLIKRFGSQRAETRWDGVLIAAPEGTDIHAVSGGQVVFADWLRGYGLLLIIDHGQGYMSLYAFNQTLYKKAGEQVTAGTAIGAVGNSGGRAEPGLYFGIRIKGKPVNPVFWCKNSRTA